MFNWVKSLFSKKPALEFPPIDFDSMPVPSNPLLDAYQDSLATYPPIELAEDPYLSTLQDALGNNATVWIDPATKHALWSMPEVPVGPDYFNKE